MLMESSENTIADLDDDYSLDQIEKLIATGTLLASAMHDIKNELTVIKGISQLGYMSKDADKMDIYFNKIEEHADKLMTMVNDALGSSKSKREELSLIKTIREVMEEIKPMCTTKDIEIEFFAGQDNYIKIHKNFMKRAILNLLTNAVQAMSEGGKLTVKVKWQGKTFIEISDTGKGIPEEIQDSIFEPFVKNKKKGTGIGLYMAYYVISKLHHGQISFKSEKGQGTTFFIEFP